MLYALRKLIAFVFLGGIFWLIYRDPEAIGSPVLMNTLGALTFIFGLFWFIVPVLVVRSRIRRRVEQNQARYAHWKSSLEGKSLKPLSKRPGKMSWLPDEEVYLHEKGTMYVVPHSGFDAVSVRGVPGDVAFPGLRRNSRKIQRTHFYLTNRRLLFVGKAVSEELLPTSVESVKAMPGGIDFTVVLRGRRTHLAFTFQNPLVVAEMIRFVREDVR